MRIRTLSGAGYRVACLAAALSLAACNEPSDPAPETSVTPDTDHDYVVDIRWTDHGIPHVEAEDRGSLGYGFAYATATDAICTIARDVLMVNGQLSLHFGPDAANRASDIFHRAMLDADMLAYFRDAQSERSTEFSSGYVAGYNRYLRDHADSLPAACDDADWVQPLTVDDVDRLTIGVGIRYGLGNFIREMANAAPPGEAVASLQSDFEPPRGYGSNAVAMGSDVTATGNGLLLGNPHYPWRGSSRFHMIHTRIPGELDVMGVSLYTTDRIAIGFNHDIAWTHTVSTGLRSTFYALELDPEDPLRYRYGDDYREMETRRVTVDVLQEDGSVQGAEHLVYMTHYGPVVSSDQLPWTQERAFAVRDANLYNTHASAMYEAMWMAQSIDDVEAALHMQGNAWTNTVAADRHGTAYYADISVVPNVDQELLSRCDAAPEGLPPRVVILDGSNPACEWRDDPRSAIRGVMPAEDMPRLRRSDYVSNSNDSYWLSNPDAPLEGYSPIIGPERGVQSLRSRAGHEFVAELLAEQGGVSSRMLQDALFAHRNFGAELLLDDLLALCDGAGSVQVDDTEVDVSASCEVLTAWDRRAANNSRGAHVWREFWRQAMTLENLYAVPFDADEPVQTPRQLNTDDPEVREALLVSLASGQQRLEEHGIALDAELGEIQYEEKQGERIAIPGGEGWAGMWSMIVSQLQPDAGYTPIVHGNSYMQVVGWDENGRVDPRGLLSYSQSDNPESPHYADQTWLYSQGQWLDLPFHEEDIAARTIRTLELRQ